jgi:uncharacterized protein (UPF0332 family)
MSDLPELPEDAGPIIFKQLLELWAHPEIEKRLAAGAMTPGQEVWAIQVIMNVCGPGPVIRLNEEVKGVAQVRVNRAINKGEQVRGSDIVELKGLDLLPEDHDAAHLTALLHASGWQVIFDFRYNATTISCLVARADEFLATANFALQTGHLNAAVDNLYDAVELMAKCHLIMSPDRGILESKTHGVIEGNYNRQRKFGNVRPDFAQTLNRLSELRPKVRYALEPTEIDGAEVAKLASSAAEMRVDVEARRPRRRDPSNLPIT